MFDRLDQLENLYEELGRQLSEPALLSDQKKFQAVAKQHRDLEPTVDKFRQYRKIKDGIAEARLMLQDSDAGIREIFVSVDGEQIAILKNGEAVTHDLPAGPHRLRVHNTLFWKTHEVVLQPGEHARFKAANKAGWGSFGFLMVLGAAPLYLTFEREH